MTNSTSSDEFWKDIHFNDTDRLILSCVAIAVGVVLAFFGKKLFKAALFVAAFIAVGGLTYYCMHEIASYHEHINFTKLELLIPVGIGLVGGFVVLGVLKLGFFLAGAVGGAAIALMVFAVVGDRLGEHANLIRLGILIACALVGGFAVLKQEKKLIALITSIGGSYLAFAGIDHFVKSGYVNALDSLFVHDKFDLPKDHLHLLLMFGGTVLLAVFGLIFQMFHNRNSSEPKAGWDDENQYLLGKKRAVNY
jgi:hypothetical protein